MPSTNETFWRTKLERNKLRDKRNLRSLYRLGWSVLVIWECETINIDLLEEKIINFLENE